MSKPSEQGRVHYYQKAKGNFQPPDFLLQTIVSRHWLVGEPDTVRSVFFESVLDGLNEARVDLQPESELLARP